jgi:hypothetical protein
MFKKIFAALARRSLSPKEIEEKYASEVDPKEIEAMKKQAFEGLIKPKVPAETVQPVEEVPDVTAEESDLEQAA